MGMKSIPLWIIISLSTTCYAQVSNIVVNANQVLNNIPYHLYGSCIEDVNHEIYGGLYDQRLYGESFEEPAKDGVSSMWLPIIKGEYTPDSTQAYNGRKCQLIINKGGIYNQGLNHWGIAIQKGHSLTGNIYLKGDQSATIELQSADGSKTYASTQTGSITNNWKKYTFELQPNATDSNARFAIYTSQAGKLWLDQVTLMAPKTAQFKGLPFRKDIAGKMQEEGLRFLRYGGTMVNAPEYRWKKMIGPRDNRPPYKGHWYPYSSNGFGIFEFLQFCEAAGFEAAFAINIEETAQDAADLVEYLKGDASTSYGSKRIADGHPAPYKVKYIEIGNEEVLFDGDRADQYDHYIERFNDLYTAIHGKDTSIQLVCSVWWRPESPNTERLFKAIDGKAPYWDLHVGGDNPREGLKVDNDLTQMEALFKKWHPHTTMKCAIFEENGGLHNQQRALGHASILNAVRRHGAFVLTSCAANALQALHQNDNGWDQGQIFFTPSSVWGVPPFYATQMAAANHQPILIHSDTDTLLDVTATRSQDNKTIVLHIVNAFDKPCKAQIDLKDYKARNVTICQLSNAVYTERKLPADNLMYTFPPASYTIIKYEK